jgi:hypothetical protein
MASREWKRRKGYSLVVGLLLIAVVIALTTYAVERVQVNRRWQRECELRMQWNEIAYAAASRAIRLHEQSPDFLGDEWEIYLGERIDEPTSDDGRLLVKTRLIPMSDESASDWIIDVSWLDVEQAGTTVQRTLESRGRRIKER